MNTVLQELASRIRGELEILDRVSRRIKVVKEQFSDNPHEQAFLESIALNLHAFYSGVERLFEQIARHVDKMSPQGDAWHRDLLALMAKEIPDTRPAVITQMSSMRLDEFRRFRHLVRNVYTTNLVPERLTGVINSLPALWEALRLELSAFADFLDDLAQAEEQ